MRAPKANPFSRKDTINLFSIDFLVSEYLTRERCAVRHEIAYARAVQVTIHAVAFLILHGSVGHSLATLDSAYVTAFGSQSTLAASLSPLVGMRRCFRARCEV